MDQYRSLQLPSFFFSGPCLVIGHFAISLVLGGIGGGLLGATALLVLQSLETLADNRLLMDQLENYITDADYMFEKEAKRILQWESYIQVHDIHISLFAQLFGVFCMAVSSAVGLLFAFAAYAYKIKTSGEAARKKAMTWAVPVFLCFTTATGCVLGFSLEGFLSLTVNVYIFVWIYISFVIFFLLPLVFVGTAHHLPSWVDILLVVAIRFPGASLITFLSTFFTRARLTLGFHLTVSILCKPEMLFCLVPVVLTLIISDIFYIVGQPIVAIDSPTSTNTTDFVVEGIFVGIITSQMVTASMGIQLFEIWQMGGAYTVCGKAAAFGSAVWGIMKGALKGRVPGPIIGGLMGVAGAVGVSLAAAVAAAADKPVPILGVMVGAAAGASMSSMGHSGLSWVFVGLCAATIPAASFFAPQHQEKYKQERNIFPKPIKWLSYVCLGIFLLAPIIITSFTYTGIYYLTLVNMFPICIFDLYLKYICFLFIVGLD